MDLYEAIMGRKSIRKFKPDHAPKEVPERIFRNGHMGPTWDEPADSAAIQNLLLSAPYLASSSVI